MAATTNKVPGNLSLLNVNAEISGSKIITDFGAKNIETDGYVKAANIISEGHIQAENITVDGYVQADGYVKTGYVIVGNAPTITSGTGAPVSTPANGSLYIRIDGTIDTALYSYHSAAWSVVGGSSKITITPVTTNYLVLTTDQLISVESISSPITITLPASPATGDNYYIKDTNGNSLVYNITITPSSGNIDGTSSYILATNYASATVVYTGSQWSVF